MVMTMRELWEWAKENNAEDYDILLNQRDDDTYNVEPMIINDIVNVVNL